MLRHLSLPQDSLYTPSCLLFGHVYMLALPGSNVLGLRWNGGWNMFVKPVCGPRDPQLLAFLTKFRRYTKPCLRLALITLFAFPRVRFMMTTPFVPSRGISFAFYTRRSTSKALSRIVPCRRTSSRVGGLKTWTLSSPAFLDNPTHGCRLCNGLQSYPHVAHKA